MERGIDTSGPNRKRECFRWTTEACSADRRRFNYALIWVRGVNEMLETTGELIHKGKNNGKLGAEIAGYEPGMFNLSRASAEKAS